MILCCIGRATKSEINASRLKFYVPVKDRTDFLPYVYIYEL